MFGYSKSNKNKESGIEENGRLEKSSSLEKGSVEQSPDE